MHKLSNNPWNMTHDWSSIGMMIREGKEESIPNGFLELDEGNIIRYSYHTISSTSATVLCDVSFNSA